MKRWALAAAVIAATAWLRASDAPPPKSDEPPPPRHKLGGGFKGQPVGTSAAQPGKPAAKPAPAPRKGGRTLVIDDKMVKGAAGEAPGSGHAGSPPPARAAAPAPPPPPVEMPKIVDLQGHDEAYWRAKAAATRDAVRKAQDALDAAEAEEKREENDFYSWDDGNYRDNVIKPAWDRARDAAVKAREDLAAAKKALDGLEDEARRAGAYPGWIR